MIDSFLNWHAFANVGVSLAEGFAGLDQGVLRQVSLGVRGEDLRDIDVEGAALDSQDFAKATQAELRGTVHGTHGVAHVARDGEHVDYLAFLPLHHAGQRRLADGDMRHAVHVHHLSAYVEGDILELVSLRAPAIIYQCIDRHFFEQGLAFLKALLRFAQIELECVYDISPDRVTF